MEKIGIKLCYQVPDSVSLSLTASMSKGGAVDVDLSVVDGLVGCFLGIGLFREKWQFRRHKTRKWPFEWY